MKNFSKIFQKYLKNISPNVVTKAIKRRVGVTHVIPFAPMVALELFFINNLNMPYWTSSCQWSSKGGTTKLDSPHLNSFLVYNTMPSIFLKCLSKLSSQSHCSQYYGYTISWHQTNTLKETIIQPFDQLDNDTCGPT